MGSEVATHLTLVVFPVRLERERSDHSQWLGPHFPNTHPPILVIKGERWVLKSLLTCE